MKNQKLKGVIPALLTAFTDDGESIDTKRVEKLVSALINQGADGFYVGGSSGEMLLCSLEERKILLEAVLEKTQNKAFVISQVGSAGLRDTLELASFAEKSGADAVSSITPIYFAYSFKEIKYFYESIAAQTSLPVIIYNVPALTGTRLSFSQLNELLNIPNVAGMKFTDSDFYQFERLKAYNSGKVFFNGKDELFLSGLAAGADGGIGTTYNFQLKTMREIYDNYKAGNMQKALFYQDQANKMIDSILKHGVIPAVKSVLDICGMPYGNCRAPFLPLENSEIEDLRQAVKNCLGENYKI